MIDRLTAQFASNLDSSRLALAVLVAESVDAHNAFL